MKADFEKGTKVCSRCKKELPISEFYKNKSKKDLLSSFCKKCHNEQTIRYGSTTEGRAKVKKYHKKVNDRVANTIGRNGNKRGGGGMLKRDYELTHEQLERRNYARKAGKHKGFNSNPHGLLIWYDGMLENIDSKEYRRLLNNEYSIQRCCAIRGYVGGKKEPSVHFLFDFDLEQMLKDNAYYGGGKYKKYIEKWWGGEIRHWTVNDGIWRK